MFISELVTDVAVVKVINTIDGGAVWVTLASGNIIY